MLLFFLTEMSRFRCVIKPTLLSLCCSAASVFKASSKSNKSYGQIIYFSVCVFKKIFQIHVGLKISVALTVNSEFIPQTKSCWTITSENVNARDFCTFYHFCAGKMLGILIDRYVGDYFITFNFLVGAHPDPSIVCSRNKLKGKESILLSF